MIKQNVNCEKEKLQLKDEKNMVVLQMGRINRPSVLAWILLHHKLFFGFFHDSFVIVYKSSQTKIKTKIKAYHLRYES